MPNHQRGTQTQAGASSGHAEPPPIAASRQTRAVPHVWQGSHVNLILPSPSLSAVARNAAPRQPKPWPQTAAAPPGLLSNEPERRGVTASPVLSIRVEGDNLAPPILFHSEERDGPHPGPPAGLAAQLLADLASELELVQDRQGEPLRPGGGAGAEAGKTEDKGTGEGGEGMASIASRLPSRLRTTASRDAVVNVVPRAAGPVPASMAGPLLGNPLAARRVDTPFVGQVHVRLASRQGSASPQSASSEGWSRASPSIGKRAASRQGAAPLGSSGLNTLQSSGASRQGSSASGARPAVALVRGGSLGRLRGRVTFAQAQAETQPGQTGAATPIAAPSASESVTGMLEAEAGAGNGSQALEIAAVEGLIAGSVGTALPAAAVRMADNRSTSDVAASIDAFAKGGGGGASGAVHVGAKAEADGCGDDDASSYTSRHSEEWYNDDDAMPQRVEQLSRIPLATRLAARAEQGALSTSPAAAALVGNEPATTVPGAEAAAGVREATQGCEHLPLPPATTDATRGSNAAPRARASLAPDAATAESLPPPGSPAAATAAPLLFLPSGRVVAFRDRLDVFRQGMDDDIAAGKWLVRSSGEPSAAGAAARVQRRASQTAERRSSLAGLVAAADAPLAAEVTAAAPEARGWRAATDAASGQVYYVHTETKQSAWRLPDGAVVLGGDGAARSNVMTAVTAPAPTPLPESDYDANAGVKGLVRVVVPAVTWQ
jgi:hypothetical protein